LAGTVLAAAFFAGAASSLESESSLLESFFAAVTFTGETTFLTGAATAFFAGAGVSSTTKNHKGKVDFLVETVALALVTVITKYKVYQFEKLSRS